MASIIDALEEACENKTAYLKMIIYSIPVFISYELFHMGNMGLFWVVGGLTALMLVTLLVSVIHNVRNVKNYTWPTFNIFDFALTAVKSLVAVGPILTLCAWGGWKVSNIQIPEIFPNAQMVYSVVVWLLFIAVMLTSFIFFSKTKKIREAYNIVTISNNCIDIIIAVLFFIPQIAILNLIIYGPVVYIFSLFGGFDNLLFAYVTSFYAILNIGITGNYLAQVDYENVEEKDGKDEIF